LTQIGSRSEKRKTGIPTHGDGTTPAESEQWPAVHAIPQPSTHPAIPQDKSGAIQESEATMAKKTVSKLQQAMIDALTDRTVIGVAVEAQGAALDNLDTEDSVATLNLDMIMAFQAPKTDKTAAQVALAKAVKTGRECAIYHLGVSAQITNCNRAGANGISSAVALRALEQAATAAGESCDMPQDCLCPAGKRLAYGQAKKTPKPWQAVAAMLRAC
jgi:hypothetical protein